MRAAWSAIAALTACSGRLDLVIPAQIETALVFGAPGDVFLWSRADGTPPIQIQEANGQLALEVLYYATPAAQLGLARGGDGRLAEATTTDTFPLPAAARGARYDPSTETLVDTDGTSAVAAAIRIDAPACGGFVISGLNMVGNGLLAGQLIDDVAWVDGVALLTTRSKFAPFLPPRAVLFEGDVSNELTLSSSISSAGRMTAHADREGFLLVYSSTAALAIFRVQRGGRVERLTRRTQASQVLRTVGYWPGDDHIYGLEPDGRELLAFELATGQRTVIGAPSRLEPPCGDRSERVVMTGSGSGVVVFAGNLPFRFAAGGALRAIVEGVERIEACEAAYVQLPTGAELVTHRASFFGAGAGQIGWTWRPSPADGWRTENAEQIFGLSARISGAVVARERQRDQLVRLAHEPSRPDIPPRACATLPIEEIRQLAVNGDSGVAVSQYEDSGDPRQTKLVHFTIAP